MTRSAARTRFGISERTPLIISGVPTAFPTARIFSSTACTTRRRTRWRRSRTSWAHTAASAAGRVTRSRWCRARGARRGAPTSASIGFPLRREVGHGRRQAHQAMNPATKPRLPASRRQEFVAASDAPRFNPDFVRRPRLIEALLESPPARLVTLTAPAGYSKTTCLAEWAVHERRPFAWVAVNRRHNDEVLLITSIVEALEEIEAIDPRVRASLAGPNPAISTVVLPRLGRSLRERIQPFVLAMDDFHVLTSTKALEVLETVLEYLPDGSQLAIASRAEPPLPLGRMRAHRQLVELTEPQLSMTKAESGELLSKVGLEPSSAQLDVLFERTEGWPAALYLVGLSLADQPNMSAAIASFAGDDRIVADYIRDEFLATTSPARLRFLTRSSVVEALSGPLCDAMLERELRRQEPEIEPKLHARASRWYAAHFDADRAIDHAIAAGDVRWTGELSWRALSPMSGRGRNATPDPWAET